MMTEVLSVSERQGMATVLLRNSPQTYSDKIQEIPLVRLKIPDDKVGLTKY